MHLHSTQIGDGPRHVVFLHGLFGQGKNFTSIAAALVARVTDLTVHLVDLPNHGRSDWTDEFSYPSMAEQVAQWLTHFDSPVALLGHSMGGKVAMLVALQRPELVDRLVVADIAPGPSAGVSGFRAYMDVMEALDLSTLRTRQQADDALAPVASPTVRGFLLQNLRRVPNHDGGPTGWRWQMNLPLLSGHLDEIAAWPHREFAPFPRPTLWVAGELSNYITPAQRPLMQTLFPQVRLVTIKGAGHWVHSEQPDAFVAVLTAFLGRA